jgi:ribosomal protein L16 Arg81 hydroxylase
VDNLSISEKVPLSPGSVVYIPPGTGHQGIDAFVNVITLPGFKPGNEIYFE